MHGRPGGGRVVPPGRHLPQPLLGRLLKQKCRKDCAWSGSVGRCLSVSCPKIEVGKGKGAIQWDYSDSYQQGTDLIDLRQIFREMAGRDFLASEATAASK